MTQPLNTTLATPAKNNKPLSIVTIGGGTGQFALLSALRDLPNINICAIVSMADSGGSTGKLRDELGILPPGDVLKCLLALSPQREIMRDMLLKRFSADGRLQGHNAGNMLLTMLSQYAGDFPSAIQAMAEMLNVTQKILPVSTDRVTLVADLDSGQRIFGESAIDLPRTRTLSKISNIYLVPHHGDSVTAYPPVLEALKNADVILLGPGDLYTSLIPNLLVPEVAQTLKDVSAPLVYLCNIMTKHSETRGFSAEDFLSAVEKTIKRKIDHLVINNRKPEQKTLEHYLANESQLVAISDREQLEKKCRIWDVDLLDDTAGILRHSTEKMSFNLEKIIRQLSYSKN